MATIDKAMKALRENSIDEPDAVPAPTVEQIADAEAKLGITFPPSFRVFLDQGGSYQLPFWETYWVGDRKLGAREIVRANKRLRKELELPEFLVAFHDNGGGDQLCFDTRKRDKNGEHPIVYWAHECSVEENLEDLEIVARNFAAWLLTEAEDAEGLE